MTFKKSFGLITFQDTGTVFSISYNGTTRFTLNKTSGFITIGATDGSMGTNALAAGDMYANGVHIGTSLSSGAEALNVTGNFAITGQSLLNGTIKFSELGANVNPSGGSQVLMYMKADKLVIAYDHGGTAKYRTLDLTSTDATWAYSTSAP